MRGFEENFYICLSMEKQNEIRKAGIGDIPAIREMAQVVFRRTYRDILSPDQMEYMMDMMYSEESLRRQMTEQRNVFLVCEGRAYAAFRPDGTASDGRPRFHLEKLYVMPSEQGTGLGRKMFDACVSEISKSLSGAAFLLELNVNRYNSAVTFYEHIGMRRARQGDFPIGHGYYMNDYIMALDC